MIDTSNYQLPEYDLWRFGAGPILFSCADVRWSALCHANSGRGGAVQGWLFLVPLDICTIPMWKPHLLCIVLIMDKLLGKHFYPACECVFVKEYLPMKKREDTSRSRGAIRITWNQTGTRKHLDRWGVKLQEFLEDLDWISYSLSTKTPAASRILAQGDH